MAAENKPHFGVNGTAVAADSATDKIEKNNVYHLEVNESGLRSVPQQLQPLNI